MRGRFLQPAIRRPSLLSPMVDDDDRRPREPMIDPLTLAGELYWNSFVSLTGLPHGALIGNPGAVPSTLWPDLYGHAQRNGFQAINGRRPALQVTSNEAPSGACLVRFDPVDNQLADVQPNPWPNPVNGYTFYFWGRIRTATSPPSPFPAANCWISNGTNDCQIGYQGNPSDPPYVLTDGGLGGFLHSTLITPMYGCFIVRFSPPMGATGVIDGFLYQLVGGVPTLFQTDMSIVSWSMVTNLQSGFQCGGVFGGGTNLSPNWDLGAVLWLSEASSFNTMKGICNFWGSQFGME